MKVVYVTDTGVHLYFYQLIKWLREENCEKNHRQPRRTVSEIILNS